ncbi:hypothetical protein GVX81_05890 [[Haemophilus] felis]|uniref:Uncharacterized protein n=1 Tax=[Haemophilus] felis TaxID=123822 RepID=A0A1T0B3B5_9PAST|nr:hypothetical protein [[Haemophilus] felis]NBI40703.1 hypothetical protein [[Haemophilus] felis]NBI42574.1 hypothetical protein [[Haemophilus] felis]OOS04690.1 hypothetical protein B0188_04740 [[Haemophilus] felis]
MSCPRSLKIICWLHIGLYTLILLGTFFSSDIHNELAQKFSSENGFIWEMLLSIGLLAAILAACVLMLKGRRLGRTIYVIASLLSLLDLILSVEQYTETLPSIIIRLVIFYFLFRQPVTIYFDQPSTANSEKQH